MAKVIVGNEVYAWGPDALAVPEDVRGEGDRVISFGRAEEVRDAILASGLGIVPEDLEPVYAITNGSRRAVIVAGVALKVWTRPATPAPPVAKPAPVASKEEFPPLRPARRPSPKHKR